MKEIVIRVATVQDAAVLREIYRPYVEGSAVTFEYDVPSEEEFQARIAAVLERYPYLVAEQDGKILGYAYAAAFNERKAYDWTAEASIYVDRTCRHQGIGGRLYRALENILQEQGILNLTACITYADTEDEHWTRNSPDFHAHLGYRQVARIHQCGFKFHHWYDIIWMEKFLGDHRPDQPAPRSFEQVRDQVAAKYGIR